MYLKRFSVSTVIALSFSLSVEAAEWTVKPRISLRTGYNDNPRMTAEDHDPVLETALTPAVKFGIAQVNRGLSGDASFSLRRFSGGSGRESGSQLDREDYDLNSQAYHGSETNIFRGQISLSRDSTLDSERDVTGDVTDDRATRDRIALAPSWERRLGEKMNLNLEYQFMNVGYSDDPGIQDLVEYDYHTFTSTLTRNLAPRTEGSISAGYSLYKPETEVESGTISLQAGISRRFSETLVTSFMAGQRQTKSDTFIRTGFCFGPGTYPTCAGRVDTGFIKDEVDSSGLVFTATIDKTLENGSLDVSLSRSSSPATDGELLDTTRLLVYGAHNFTNQLQASLSISLTEREAIVNRFGEESNQDTETYLRIRPGISYRWSRAWALSGYYDYVSNEDINSGDATRNAVYLSLHYNPSKASWSR